MFLEELLKNQRLAWEFAKSIPENKNAQLLVMKWMIVENPYIR
jgi:hypothetical protein